MHLSSCGEAVLVQPDARVLRLEFCVGLKEQMVS
jgi:hypothetical protein